MSVTLAFDVYGTLIDTHGVVVKLEEFVGDRAQEFSNIWREKQLEYSFRRGLMRRYETFAVCTSHALDYTNEFLDTGLDADQKKRLLEAYRVLPAFADVKQSLEELKAAGHAMVAFSNGAGDAVEALLAAANIRDLFDGVVSVHDKQTFKPNPDVYEYLLQVTSSSAGNTWLISSNPFDVIGAVSHGLNSAWVKRSDKAIFDPWGIEPTLIISNLRELGAYLAEEPGKEE